jgi:hypothetical protein
MADHEFSLARALATVTVSLDPSGDYAWFRYISPEHALAAYARLGDAYQPYCEAPKAPATGVRVPIYNTDVFTAMRDILLHGSPADEVVSEPSTSQSWRVNYTPPADSSPMD